MSDQQQQFNKERLKTIAGHLNAGLSTGQEFLQQPTRSAIPKRRQDLLRSEGWGYKDSGFEVNLKEDICRFHGDRYPIGNKMIPHFIDFICKTFGVDRTLTMMETNTDFRERIPAPVINQDFLDDLSALIAVNSEITFSTDPDDRLFRSHGQCLHEIFSLHTGDLKRLPDLIVWPRSHENVVELVHLAGKHSVVLIPFGGGTSVSGALECPSDERRMIVSLDTSQMNAIKWIDHQNLTAKVEAGIVGQDLERELAKFNLCCGHEPDSCEFSSLGGWIATRASGMKKNVYGNIEDIVVHVKMVTARGVVERNCTVPRVSIGPDIQHFVFGSEGTLGVITEAVIKVRPLPECKKYGSLVFPDFECGFKFMREIARQRLKPASVRLLDHQQFVFGQAIRPEEMTVFTGIKKIIEKFYLFKLKGFDENKITVATLLFEGTKEEVETLESKVIQLGIKFGAISGGEENGRRGYMLTFVIAYIRDIAIKYRIVAESFETSAPWDRCLDLCRNVAQRIERECKQCGVIRKPFISYRITQTYDAGACIYFYFGYFFGDMPVEKADPIHIYEKIEAAAREEILANGGSLSHHHGVGKLRKQWLRESVSDTGLALMRAIKREADPENIFANGNLMT